MLNFTTRGRLQAASALIISTVLVLFVALFGGSSASAQSQPLPTSVPVTITKLSQPGTLGSAATGEPLSALPAGATPIRDVVFDYYLVENTGADGTADIGTIEGQRDAASLTPATATIPGSPTGSFPATSPAGETTATLPRGLYVVQEDPTSVPAGVTAAAPFMLAVPLTNPTNLDEWLDHIYVYPKNSQIDAEKTVENAADLIVGDTVTWTINADIPRVENPAYNGSNARFIAPDYFRIDDTLQADQLVLDPAFNAVSNTGIRVTAGTTSLVEGTDYGITEDSSTSGANTYQILFTQAGREALAAAVNLDPIAKVSVELDTKVLAAEVIDNTASVFPNQNSVTQNEPLVTPAEEVRYGSYNFQKDSSDDALTDLSGAQFRVYSNLDDAEALTNHLEPTTGPTDGLWETDASGQISINGLRHSGFADGESFTEADPRYITYYLVEVQALDGHQLLAAPVPFTVDETTGASTPWTSDETIVNQATTGAFVLPLTGGSGTAMLTIAGILILAVVLFLARRRSASEA
ncbi:SpaH/EbpB family LPXTG-anchored major pilin [Corynebacterium gallinarum]|uniref:SpaH/EbpB family LPXTG-anchored major pilin n=1 Tax=Corynebacterium gallinarum TaxID=2762214 RepID=A0A8I0HJ12_9CORY|nr:SpaH/EbpB family LPXTG-anchored major pilin [Corynebacterium gallinarum]MBD8029995.1 SpaH/EbpB family LPXTG-anchored major pilin [Corynebacterium gallinarum]